MKKFNPYDTKVMGAVFTGLSILAYAVAIWIIMSSVSCSSRIPQEDLDKIFQFQEEQTLDETS